MRLFYSPSIQKDSKFHKLEKEESHHLVKVLRLSTNDLIEVVNGKGDMFSCRVVLPNQKGTELEILSLTPITTKRNYKVHVAIAPTKHIDRFEWFIEKATEIGVDEVTPLLCDHSERKVIKHERLQKILVSAMKQSGRANLPKLNELTKAHDFISNAEAHTKCVAHCVEDVKESFSQICKTTSDVLILIGPEGDFSLPEIELAKKHNYKAVSLGKSRLRTESAGLVSCLTMSIIHENSL